MNWILRNWLAVTSFGSVCITGGAMFSDAAHMQKEIDGINQTKPDVLQSKIEQEEASRSLDEQSMSHNLEMIHSDLQSLHDDVSYIKGCVGKNGERP